MSDLTPDHLWRMILALQADVERVRTDHARAVEFVRSDLSIAAQQLADLRSEIERHNREAGDRRMSVRARNVMYAAIVTAAVGGLPAIIEAITSVGQAATP